MASSSSPTFPPMTVSTSSSLLLAAIADDGFNTYNTSPMFYGIAEPGVFSWRLVAFNTVSALVPALGLVLNALLVLVTVGDKNLNGTCNQLLAVGAVCDFTYHVSFFITFAISLSGINFIRLELCYWVQAVSVFGVFSSVWVVLFVGLDRLLSVLFPLWHRTVNRLAYFSLAVLVDVGYGLYILVIAFEAVQKYPHWPVTCRIIDSFAFGDLQTLIFRNGLVVNGASLVIYALVGAAIHKLHGSKISARAVQQQPTAAVADQQGGVAKQPPAATPNSSSSERRIFRALLAIMVFVVGTYFGTCVVALATASVTSPFYQQYAGPMIQNLLAQCAATCNTPLLLVFSNDYRRAFHTVLGRFAVTRPLRRLVPKPQGFVSHATVIDQQTAAPTRGVGGVRPPPLGTITLAASKPRVGGCYVTPTAGSDLFPRVTDTPTGSEGRITGYGLKGGNGTVLDATPKTRFVRVATSSKVAPHRMDSFQLFQQQQQQQQQRQ